MTIEELLRTAERAVAANFPVRNARVFGGATRHAAATRARRRIVREWVATLRYARDPANAAAISKAILGGPLMAHDLRARVVLAGCEAIAQRTHMAARH